MHSFRSVLLCTGALLAIGSGTAFGQVSAVPAVPAASPPAAPTPAAPTPAASPAPPPAAAPSPPATPLPAPAPQPAPLPPGPKAGPGAPLPPTLKVVGIPAASQQVEFDIILPLRNVSALNTLLAAQQNPSSPQYHHWLTPVAFGSQFGASPKTVAQVTSDLLAFGLQVIPQSRSLHVTGTALQVNNAFNTSLAVAAKPSGQLRLVVTKALAPPQSLSSANAIISAFSSSGFDAAPFVRLSSLGYVRLSSLGYEAPASSSSPGGGYFYNDLKQAYHYPSYQSSVTVNGKPQRLDGTGTTVAVLMSGDVLDSDISTLFNHQNFTANSGQPADPALFARRLVNGGTAFSATNPGSEEASVDIEQVLGGAPGSRVILYNTPDLSDQSLISGYTAIVNDNLADVVSLSLGQCEMYYTAAYNSGQDQTAILNTFTELFEQGTAQGITFVAASGDAGGLGCITPGYFSGSGGSFTAGVSTPAADPNVTAVGGTNLVTTTSLGIPGAADPLTSLAASTSYLRENAFSDPELPFDPYGMGSNLANGTWGAGGGISGLYPKPSYQFLVSTSSSSYRTVPDVGMAMGGCPDIANLPCNGGGQSNDGTGNAERSYLNVVFNGYWDSVIGTSTAAPEFASAVALLVEAQGRQGNINPYLYSLAQGQASGGMSYFHQSIPGFNGLAMNAGTYNLTTGNGTPDVLSMLGMTSAPAAGTPRSASNP